MNPVSTKPYLIRAICEWCSDCGFTPYLNVKVDANTRVPTAYVKNGEIVLNISHAATRNLTISNERIQFSARFNGVSHEVSVPIEAVAGILAKETGQGMLFQVETAQQSATPVPAQANPSATPSTTGPGDPPSPPARRKGNLKVVK